MRLALVVVVVMLAGGGADANPADAERQAVIATVQLYFQGHATGNGDFFKKAFHPDAKIMSVKDGVLAQKTVAEFAAGAAGKPADDEPRRMRKIVSIDIAGDAATVRVELDYPSVGFTDFFTLLQIDNRWVIMNKVFHRRGGVPSRK